MLLTWFRAGCPARLSHSSLASPGVVLGRKRFYFFPPSLFSPRNAITFTATDASCSSSERGSCFPSACFFPPSPKFCAPKYLPDPLICCSELLCRVASPVTPYRKQNVGLGPGFKLCMERDKAVVELKLLSRGGDLRRGGGGLEAAPAQTWGMQQGAGPCACARSAVEPLTRFSHCISCLVLVRFLFPFSLPCKLNLFLLSLSSSPCFLVSPLPEDHYISSYQKGTQLEFATSLIFTACATRFLGVDWNS